VVDLLVYHNLVCLMYVEEKKNYKNQGLCVLSWSALSSNAPCFVENIETKGFTNLNSFFWKHIRGFDVQLH
jgi:hypothetical protein